MAPGFTKLDWLLCLSSGLLYFAAAPPHPLGFLGFICLVPLLFALRHAASYKTAAAGGFAAGSALFLPGLFWLTDVTALGWIALALYCACYLLAFACFAKFALERRPLPAAILLPAFWLVLEYVRGWLFTGFPWLLLSHTQGGFHTFIQAADIVGAYGLGAVIVAVNVLVFDCLRQRKPLPAGAIAAALLLLPSVYGYLRLQQIPIRNVHRIAAVQASIPQEMKMTLMGHYDPGGVLNRYLAATKSIPGGEKFDVIVWPETVLLTPYTINVNPEALAGEDEEASRIAQDALAQVAERHEAYMLVGATTYLPASYGYVSDRKLARNIPEGAWKQRYNSGVLLDPQGRYTDRYDKMHLVPFGEYIPLPSIAPFLARLVPFESSLIAGERQTIFQAGKNGTPGRFGVLICYEDTDSELARRLRRGGADYFVNISNDAWFGPSELDQHFVVAQFRAIENRVGVVRSGNNGYTAVIDPFGRITSQVLKRNAVGHITGDVAATDTHTIYTAVGDLPFFIACAVLSGFSLSRRRATPGKRGR